MYRYIYVYRESGELLDLQAERIQETSGGGGGGEQENETRVSHLVVTARRESQLHEWIIKKK